MSNTEEKLLRLIEKKDTLILELMNLIARNNIVIPELWQSWKEDQSRQQYELEEILLSFGIKLTDYPDHTDITQDAINDVVVGGHTT